MDDPLLQKRADQLNIDISNLNHPEHFFNAVFSGGNIQFEQVGIPFQPLPIKLINLYVNGVRICTLSDAQCAALKKWI